MQIQKQYLSQNPYSRPGIQMKQVKGIVVHYVGNGGSSAMVNRNYFENLKVGQKMLNGQYRYASSHYIVGLEGEIIQCVPEEEMAYHAGAANGDHIGVEVCHPKSDGKFSSITYEALVKLLFDLCKRYKLNPLKAIIRHYDVSGKDCPKYYVAHQGEWDQLKQKVNEGLQEKAVSKMAISLNGKVKWVETINIEGHNYVKLRDLSDDKILVSYDATKKTSPCYSEIDP
jgi:N-acetylmuramoyl-L-alanine amidase